MVSAAGTLLVREPLLGGGDFAGDGVPAETGLAGRAGVAMGSLAWGSLVRRAGVAGLTGATAEAGGGGGGVGTGSFFPVRGERDLGGMSRTLGDADHRLGIRLRGSLNWLSPAAQTVFPKVLIWRITKGEGLERGLPSLSLRS